MNFNANMFLIPRKSERHQWLLQILEKFQSMSSILQSFRFARVMVLLRYVLYPVHCKQVGTTQRLMSTDMKYQQFFPVVLIFGREMYSSFIIRSLLLFPTCSFSRKHIAELGKLLSSVHFVQNIIHCLYDMLTSSHKQFLAHRGSNFFLLK